MIPLDRAIASRGLAGFVRIAWSLVYPHPLIWNWHLTVLCDWLTSAPLRRVANVPPATGKSSITGIFWPAWVWTHAPATQWMYVSFDTSLLNRDSEKLINLLLSRWYVERWGARLKGSTHAVSDFQTIQGGGRFNTSFGGKGTGRHAHKQVIDDPVKPSDAAAVSGAELEFVWGTIADTFASRAIEIATFERTIIGQRVHEGDPSGRALEAGWSGLRLPMLYEADEGDPLDQRTTEGEPLFPARFPIETLERMRTMGDLTPDVWETQYQQRPAARAGGIFHEAWLHTHNVIEARARCWYTVQSWDLSFKGTESSDFVAAQWWGVGPALPGTVAESAGEPMFFELDEPVFDRMSFVESLSELRLRRTRWPAARIFIEDKANGPAAESVLSREMIGLLEMVNPKGGKVARATGVSPLFANDRVRFADTPSWESRRKRTYTRFPRVRRDDEIDATTQALSKLSDAGILDLLSRDPK